LDRKALVGRISLLKAPDHSQPDYVFTTAHRVLELPDLDDLICREQVGLRFGGRLPLGRFEQPGAPLLGSLAEAEESLEDARFSAVIGTDEDGNLSNFEVEFFVKLEVL